MRRTAAFILLIVAAACGPEIVIDDWPLTVTTDALPGANPTVAYNARLHAIGGDGNYTWSVTSGSLPTGLTLDPSTGTIAGSPTGSSSTFTVQVTSGDGQVAVRDLMITVTLVIATTTLPNATPSVGYEATLMAMGATGSYTWSLTIGSLPAGLTLAPSSGTITGTPTGASSTFTVRVTSDDGQVAERELSIAVTDSLIITTMSLPTATPAVTYSATLMATGGDGSYTWSVTVGSLPAGLTLNPSAGAITGTPTGTSSTFTVRVTSADGQVAERELTIAVTDSLVITTISLADATPSVTYNATLMATGGDGDYIWSVIVGSLPVGLILTPLTGTITGVPTAASTTFTVQVVSADGQVAEQELTITVTLVITTTTLPDATPTNAYSAILAATGGSGSYTWTLESGSLPEGLALAPTTGAITGIPTGATATFTIHVTSGDGQVAEQTLTIIVTPPPLLFQSMTTGNYHSCGVTPTGAAYCWGLNVDGRLGDGTTTQSNVPVAVLGGLAFQSVNAGALHNCGVTTSGAAYCWGNNYGVGALGDGTAVNSAVPVAVLSGLIFHSVSGGNQYSCGLTTAGAAYCWGYNGYGELGNGTNTSSTVPVAVSGGLTFQSVSTTNSTSCGVTIAGVAYCWGANEHGQLGNGTNTHSNVPVAVAGGLTFQLVGAGDHSCGVSTAWAAYCWGDNYNGGLGDNTRTDSNLPVAVAGGLTFQSVSPGIGFHSCGVTTALTAYCWGRNFRGELGNGTNTGMNVPVAVSNGLTFRSVSTGGEHSCGLTTAGAGYCWGLNNFGQLGDSSYTNRNVPAMVGWP